MELDTDEMKRRAGTERNRIADRLYNYLSDTPIGKRNYRLVLEDAAPAQLIVRIAVNLDADLIAMGTCSAGRRRNAILGSVAEQVHRHAHSDVLVVQPSPAIVNPDNEEKGTKWKV